MTKGKLTILFIPVTGPIELREIDDDIKSLQQQVGGLIQECPLPEPFCQLMSLWCDEEFIMKRKPINLRAYALLVHFYNVRGEELNPLGGDVFIAGGMGSETMQSIPDGLVSLFNCMEMLELNTQ